LSSAYPLAFTHRRVNATPPTPAAGNVTTFARLNGAKMEFCMITPSGAIVVLGAEP
jgi:hypothetical protein